jgi:hypothetical protein
MWKKVGPAGIKSEGEIKSLITIPYAPAHGSGDGGIGSLFALNPDAMGGGTYLPYGGG